MKFRSFRRAYFCAATALIALTAGFAAAGAQSASAAVSGTAARAAASTSVKPTVVYQDLTLAGGETATVYSNGMAEVFSADHKSAEYRMIPPSGSGEPGTAADLPSKGELIAQLSSAPASPYVAGTVEVVLPAADSATSAEQTVSAGTLKALRAATPEKGGAATGTVPQYTTNTGLNHLLAGLGVDKMTQAFDGTAALSDTSAGPLDLAHTYVLHVTNATVPQAVSALLASSNVAYASPDWTVAAMHTSAQSLPAAARSAAANVARAQAAAPSALSQPADSSPLPALPGNYALATSEQSLLNSTSVNWVPAYEALEARYGQLPGTGEVITDVSLGDLDSSGLPTTDPCSFWTTYYGPTTVIQNGQRYLDLPSMPLIPTWTSSDTGTVDPTGEVCGVDPYDSEIDLDFSMMAPLPDSLQRAGELGSGLTDLLGIAPGASYRLVVPSDTSGSITSVDEAFLAAAQQTPAPNVITASLGFGLDSEGFPSRYLEDDPVTEQLVASLVHTDHINVSIAAGDGLRTATNASVAPSGGAAATNVAPNPRQVTSLDDVQFSTTASADPDSGSIDAGGVTLDDIAAAPPQDPATANLASDNAFPEVRWDGSANFASGYGSRVDVSAPADNVIAFEHPYGGGADDVETVDIGGTSASAQEIGAAAAVVQQAARLAGNRSVARNPEALRSYLEQTGTPVPQVSQADRSLDVGPQLNLGAAVTGLLRAAGYQLPAGVARVAVAQRQPLTNLDAFFTTVTDPSSISLVGANQNALVTIAPDWTGLPTAGVSYQLYAVPASGPRKLLATGPSARLQPDAILAGAGLQPSPQSPESVTLDYVASSGRHVLTQASIPLTFTAVSGTPMPLAPVVSPVVTGKVIAVKYNLAGQQSVFTDPVLEVSEPGRVNPDQEWFHPSYSVPLTATSGTVDIPVSALQGGGVYGIGIAATPTEFFFSDFAVTRVQDAPSDVRPAAPLLSADGSAPGHLLTIGYGDSFKVSWNVRDVPQATGAILEISSGGPNVYGSYATFNNPDGTIRDDNGWDIGSASYTRLNGTAGTTTVNGLTAGLYATLYDNVRVIPVLRDGKAAGEGSDVSTVSMDGITPADGGSVTSGFGINANGTDGLLASNQVTASGQTESSVETFSQTTGAITGTVVSSTSGDEYSTAGVNGPGIFAGDTGLYVDSNTSVGYLLSPAASGTPSGEWTPPTDLIPSTAGDFLVAPNEATATDAMIGTSPSGEPVVFGTDVGADTFGPGYSLESAISGFGAPYFEGLAQDTATNTAVAAVADFDNLSAGATLITVNLANGQVATIPDVGDFYPSGVAVDPGTDTAAAPQINGIAIYNLASGTGTFVTESGAVYQHPADDPTLGEYLIQEVAPPGASGAAPTLNNNALSAVDIVNDQGQIVRRIERFNFYNVNTFIAGAQTQLNPSTSTGYTFGLLGDQIEPFSY